MTGRRREFLDYFQHRAAICLDSRSPGATARLVKGDFFRRVYGNNPAAAVHWDYPKMTCCPPFERLMDRDLARRAQPYRLQYVGLNYCPFCGRVLSRELWNLERKK